MRIGDKVYVNGYVDEIRKDVVIIRNDGGYFGTVESEITDTIGAVKHGEWSRHTLGSTSGYGTTVMHQCSECESMTISRFRYCPNCGAKMDVERKEE